MLKLDKVVRHWKRLTDDDRFRRTARNAPQLREDLLRAVGELQKIAEMIEPSHNSLM